MNVSMLCMFQTLKHKTNLFIHSFGYGYNLQVYDATSLVSHLQIAGI